MRVIAAEATNFASYKEVALDLTQKGLTLISGQTGSGKSTLCDIVPWVLFGRTAKDGAVDEVRSWSSTAPTTGKVTIDHPSYAGQVMVFRSRKPNDLYYIIGPGVEKRGKDLSDTQKQVEDLLGVTYATYLCGAYFHEFSQSAAFFVAPAKTRRSTLDQVADLSLANKLTDKLTSYKKDVAKIIEDLARDVDKKQTLVDSLRVTVDNETTRAREWQTTRDRKVAALKTKIENFDKAKEATLVGIRKKFASKRVDILATIEDMTTHLLPEEHLAREFANIKKKLEALGDEKCSACGAMKNSSERLILVKREHELERAVQDNDRVKAALTSYNDKLDLLDADLAEQLEAASNQQETHTDELKELLSEVNQAEDWLAKSKRSLELETKALAALQEDHDSMAVELSDAVLLQDVTAEFRAQVVKNTVVELERRTNSYLTEVFDAELRVMFTADSDKIDVTILKDGNKSTYAQLSKGQRQLLRLSFGVAVMKSVQTHNSVSFNCIWLDEALDGLDDSLKSKSYRLLQSLAEDHESVFVVEHNENLKNMFHRRLEVRIIDGRSIVTEA